MAVLLGYVMLELQRILQEHKLGRGGLVALQPLPDECLSRWLRKWDLDEMEFSIHNNYRTIKSPVIRCPVFGSSLYYYFLQQRSYDIGNLCLKLVNWPDLKDVKFSGHQNLDKNLNRQNLVTNDNQKMNENWLKTKHKFSPRAHAIEGTSYRLALQSGQLYWLLDVEYFDQRLGAAHSKRWLEQSLSAFFVLKSFKKASNLQQNFAKNTFF